MADLARIKRNVAKMVGMGAPETDIDAYIAQEGVTVEDVRAFKPQADLTNPAFAAASQASQSLQGGPGPRSESYDEGMFAQAASGANQGIANVLGLPVDLTTAGINALGQGSNAMLGTDFQPIDRPIGGSRMFGEFMGQSIKPETDDPTKQFVRRMTEEYGAAAIPMLGQLSRAAMPLRLAATEAGIVTGTGAGAAAAEQIAPDNPVAELGGQLLGGLTAGGMARLARKAITPLPGTQPARQAAVDTMKREGVDLTAGQQTGSKRLQYMESSIGGSKIADITERQSEQFTAAVLKRAGIRANRATPEVMQKAADDIGAEMDGLQARNPMAADRQLGADLSAAFHDYHNLAGNQAKPIFDNILADIFERLNKGGGKISGNDYKALRSRIEAMARKTGDHELADSLRDMKSALDDAVERWIAQNNPADLGAWKQVRNEYRNLLVIERAAQGAGENAAMGIISPAAVRNASQVIFGKRSNVRGRNDFAELSQAGQATMSPLPQSGTEPRLAAKAKHLLNPLNWIDGAVAAAILSQPGKKYLANQLLKKGGKGSRLTPATTMLAGQTSNRRPLPPLEITVPYGDLTAR